MLFHNQFSLPSHSCEGTSLLPYFALSHCSVFKVQVVERNFTPLASPFGKVRTVPFFLLFPFQTLRWFEMGTLAAFAVRFEDPILADQVFKSKGKPPGGPEWARTTDLTIISRTL